MVELAEGVMIHGYRIERLLGRGGMGEVHLAHHTESGRSVALKSMNREASSSEEFRKRFRREARAAMAVRHPNVVSVHEIFENDGTPFIAMEVLDGETLEQRMVREGALPLQLVARIALRVTSAVGSAHAMGIVHRDLKPENVFLIGGADDPEVKVLDFGIAKLTATGGEAAETAALTRTGALMGTPYYMSPEQAFGEKRIDQRADVWALGIILYRALSGVLPTRAAGFGEVFRLVVQAEFKPLRELCPDVPGEVTDLVDAMLAKKVDARPWDLRECYEVLKKHTEGSTKEVTSFGMAVAPLWDEATTATEEPSATSAALPGKTALGITPGGSKPLAMSPGALRLQSLPSLAGGDTAMLPSPAEDGAATLFMAPPNRSDPPAANRSDPPAANRSDPPATNRSDRPPPAALRTHLMAIGVGVALVLLAAAVVVLR